MCAVEGCEGDHGVHLFCPPLWGKQDKGMRTDGLREGAALLLFCVSGLVSQSFPSLLGGRTAGRFVYSRKYPSRLPSDGFSSAVSKCVPHFSLPPFCSQPSTQPLMLWACVKVPWKTRGSPLNTSASFPLLRVGPEQAAFLKVVSVLVFELFVGDPLLPFGLPWALPASTGI